MALRSYMTGLDSFLWQWEPWGLARFCPPLKKASSGSYTKSDFVNFCQPVRNCGLPGVRYFEVRALALSLGFCQGLPMSSPASLVIWLRSDWQKDLRNSEQV